MWFFIGCAVTSLITYYVGYSVGYSEGLKDSLSIMEECMDEAKALVESEMCESQDDESNI